MLLVVGLLHLSFMYSGSFSRLNAEDVVSLVWSWANLSTPLGGNCHVRMATVMQRHELARKKCLNYI